MKFRKTLALLALCALSASAVGTAYADVVTDTYQNVCDSQADYEEYVLENSREGKMTPESLEKFNQHIASLELEFAEAILSDEELVYCMKLDTYWEEPNEMAVMPYANVELPLSSFPADGKTYFSADKTKGCECHKCTCQKNNDSHWCTYNIPSGFSTARCYDPEAKQSGTCRRYNGSIQCKAFADYVFKTYTGSYCGSTNEDSDRVVSSSEWTTKNVKDALNGIPKGSHVRGYLSSYPHSIIVLSTNASGITYYHANVDGHCLIAVETKTWSEFASWFTRIDKVWTA